MPNNQRPGIATASAQISTRGKVAGGGLAAIVGATAAAMLYTSIPQDEGNRSRAYYDMVGVLTICSGDTHGVIPGEVDTPAQCRARLDRQLIAHATPLMACVPQLAEAGHDFQRVAFVSFGYNVGAHAACNSSVARNFRAHNWRAGCNALMAWNKAGGRVVAGLTARRARERAICNGGL